MAYSNKVIDHYENPRNVGSFDRSESSVGTGMVGSFNSLVNLTSGRTQI